MKKVLRNTLMASTLALLVACGGNTLDAKNDQTLEASIEKITAEMSREEARDFMGDLEAISRGVLMDMGGMTIDNLENMEKIEDRVMSEIDGKSVSGVKKLAQKYAKASES